MTALEICLIVIGIVTIAISYFISDKNAEERMQKAVEKLVFSEETKQSLIKQTRETIEETLNGMSEEIAEKAEIQLEKLSTEKIMAVHDYSDTVLEEIGKSHSEVMFLYSMLNDKEREVKSTVKEAQKTVKSMRHDKTEQTFQVEQISNAIEKNFEKEEKKNGTTVLLDMSTEKQITSENRKYRSLTKMEKEKDFKIKDKKSDAIIKLYRQGKSNVEIAKELGYGMGEVRLVIDLYCASEESKGNVI